MNTKTSFIKTLAAAAVALAATGAAQAQFNPDACKELKATNSSGIKVTECTGSYELYNGSSEAVTAFFVSTAQADITSTMREGWFSRYLSASSFRTQFLNLGSFASLFGSEDVGVNYYFWDGEEGGSAIGAGLPASGFYFRAPMSSEFVALGSKGQILAQSFSPSTVAAVPEPGTYALMALGLTGVGMARRRRQG